MTIKDLKEKLENSEWYFNSLLIFSGAESDFLKSQYLKQLIKIQDRQLQYLNSIDELCLLCDEVAYDAMFDSTELIKFYMYFLATSLILIIVY